MTTTRSFTFVDPNGRREKATPRVNPDLSLGGWVAKSAKVDPTAIVEAGAYVEPGAVVGPGELIPRGKIVTGPM